MIQRIPRALVAKALDVAEDALPEGDLPLERLATRFLMFLRDTAGDDDAFEDHPEVWTAVVATALAERDRDLSFDLICALLAKAETPQDIGAIAEGPMTELFAAHGPDLLPAIEATAARAPRFAAALAACPPEAGGALFLARLKSLSTPLVEEDLPFPTGLS